MVMRLILTAISAAIVIASCGEKIPLPSNVRDDDGGRLTDTTFVAVLPHWTSAGGIPFNTPLDVTVGYDRTIYVCDTRNDRIVRLTPSGEFIESYAMPHPFAVAQDRSFGLAAVDGKTKVWVRRYPEGGDFVEYAEMDSTWRCIPQPHEPAVCYWDVPELTKISATGELRNVFYVVGAARVSYIISDRALVDTDFYPIVDSGGAYGALYAPTSAIFASVRGQRRLIIAQFPAFYGVQYLSIPSYQPVFPDTGQDIFNMVPNDVKYLAADERGNVFVLHRISGVVMMFDKDGGYILSFGHSGTDELGVDGPRGIAVLDDIVLIADSRNNRISRYQMTAVPQN